MYIEVRNGGLRNQVHENSLLLELILAWLSITSLHEPLNHPSLKFVAINELWSKIAITYFSAWQRPACITLICGRGQRAEKKAESPLGGLQSRAEFSDIFFSAGHLANPEMGRGTPSPPGFRVKPKTLTRLEEAETKHGP